jgi:hypothetical protein
MNPVGMAAGAGSLWIASRNPDAVVRIGPVLLPPAAPSAGGPPLLLLALGSVTGLLLVVRGLLLRASRRGGDRNAPDGHLLAALLQMTQRVGSEPTRAPSTSEAKWTPAATLQPAGAQQAGVTTLPPLSSPKRFAPASRSSLASRNSKTAGKASRTWFDKTLRSACAEREPEP